MHSGPGFCRCLIVRAWYDSFQKWSVACWPLGFQDISTVALRSSCVLGDSFLPQPDSGIWTFRMNFKLRQRAALLVEGALCHICDSYVGWNLFGIISCSKALRIEWHEKSRLCVESALRTYWRWGIHDCDADEGSGALGTSKLISGPPESEFTGSVQSFAPCFDVLRLSW